MLFRSNMIKLSDGSLGWCDIRVWEGKGDYSGACPTVESWQNWNGERAEKVIDLGFDGNYYDISGSIGYISCDDSLKDNGNCISHPNHDHPIGYGRWMLDAYEAQYNNNRANINSAHPEGYAPQGNELIVENYVDDIDFYYARAEGGPLGFLEAGEGNTIYLRECVLSHDCEKIPMFEYIYHEYGPVKVDGDLKLSSDLSYNGNDFVEITDKPGIGDIFYWSAGKMNIRGGLPLIEYSMSSLEVFPDNPETNPPTY